MTVSEQPAIAGVEASGPPCRQAARAPPVSRDLVPVDRPVDDLLHHHALAVVLAWPSQACRTGLPLRPTSYNRRKPGWN